MKPLKISVAAMVLTACCSSCTKALPEQPRPDTEVGRIVEGFRLYETLSMKTGEAIASKRPEKIRDLDDGVGYLFKRKSGPPDELALGCKVLPERLAKEGFRVIKHPLCTGEGLIHVDPGGTLFDVIGIRGGCTLSVGRRPVRKGRWEWINHDQEGWLEAGLDVSGRGCK